LNSPKSISHRKINLNLLLTPNPQLNSDPACFVFRSFSSPVFLGFVQRLGEGHLVNGGFQEGSVPRTALTQNQALWVLENYSGMILLDS
jgi:hypothetical protein